MKLLTKAAIVAVFAAAAAPAVSMDLQFDIQNTSSQTLSIVQVDGGDNLMDGDIGPGQSATIYLEGLDDDDCEHTVSITTENADEYEVYVDLCEIDGMSVDDDEINVY